MVLFHNVETRFRVTEKFAPADFLSGQAVNFGDEPFLEHLGMYFALFLYEAVGGLEIWVVL